MHKGSENKGAIVYIITVGIVTTIAALIIFKVTGISATLDSLFGVMSEVEEFMDELDDYSSLFR